MSELFTSRSMISSRTMIGPETGATGTVPTRNFEGLVDRAIGRAAKWLLGVQFNDGYWWGELEADTTLESDYIGFQFFMGSPNSPKIPKLATYVRSHQLADGGWNIFPGGPA